MRTALLAMPLTSLLFASAAWASLPSSIYSVPARVDVLPDEATGDRVVIEGKFMYLTAAQDYSEVRCGILYFQCPAGQEALCRLQWSELRALIGRPFCGGFGTDNLVSHAVLRHDRSALGAPDRWDLGMGINQAVYLNGKCPPALQFRCSAEPTDGGMLAPDARTLPDAGSSVPDAVTATPDVAAGMPDAPVAAPDVAVDSATAAPAAAHGSSCAVVWGRPGSATVLLPIGLLLGALLARRTRAR
jgi:hypothetical protein